jgi:hypothetical protein
MAQAKPGVTIAANDPVDHKGELKAIGGSTSDAFNSTLANSVINALWVKNSDAAEKQRQFTAAACALVGIAPRDELEGMLAAQLIAANAAAMECYRRAMLPDQTFEGRKETLTQANKLSRTYATLLEALNRHRGKGQQKVTVEHVHVHSGGQAIVGSVETGGGVASDKEKQPDAKQLAHAPVTPLQREDQERETVSGGSDAER